MYKGEAKKKTLNTNVHLMLGDTFRSGCVLRTAAEKKEIVFTSNDWEERNLPKEMVSTDFEPRKREHLWIVRN